MTLHQVAAEVVGQPQRSFEVHGVVPFERTQRGALQGLDDGVGGPPSVAAVDDSQATTVHRDRVAGAYVGEHPRGRNLEPRASFAAVDRADASELLDDA